MGKVEQMDLAAGFALRASSGFFDPGGSWQGEDRITEGEGKNFSEGEKGRILRVEMRGRMRRVVYGRGLYTGVAMDRRSGGLQPDVNGQRSIHVQAERARHDCVLYATSALVP